MARRKNSRVTSYCIARSLVVLAMLPTLLYGQAVPAEPDSLDWVTLQEVEVNALALSTSKFEYGGMIGTIGAKKIALGSPTIVSDEMNKIPGVYWHSGALNTNRITIRGIGSRSPFSTNKIRAYYGDIPLTDGGGETTLEDIDLNFVSEVEVQKGANSSIYGSGLGGTIFLKRPVIDNNSMETNLTLGSFGLVGAGVKGSIAASEGIFRMGYQSLQSDGYRDNNSFDRQTLFISSDVTLGKNEISFLGLFIDQRAFIPSSLGITNFEENPRNAAFIWGAAKGFEDYKRWLVGLSWTRKLTVSSKIVSSIYTTGRDAFEPRPFNILQEENVGFGIRSRLEKTMERWSFHSGFEAFFDTYKAKTFENLQPTNGSEQGPVLTSVKHPRSYLNLFAESRFEIYTNLHASVGTNFNMTSYKIENSVPSALQSNNILNPIVSPRVSITYGINSLMNVYATLSRGFSPLSVDDSTNPDGSLNSDIEPETGWNREMGWKLADGKTNIELSLYSMAIRNLLVTRRTADDIIFGVNAGRTLHNGLELDFESIVVNKGSSQVIADLSYSFSHFEFKEFIDDQSDFTGNQLTGVPKHQLSFDLRHEVGWFFSGLSYQFVDQIPITDDNSIFSDGYQLVSLRAGAKVNVGEKWSGSMTLRLNNVLDEKYASMLSINANSFGGNEARYFYPGLPRNYQTSFNLTYRL
ncbi:MAG: TonB-dependent receptor [Cyclobacteriaceae bacterium]